MKRILWCAYLAVFLIWPHFAQPQISGNATIHPFPGVPTGNCSARQLAIDQSNGSLYTCINAGTGSQGTWQIVAGGVSGGGWNPPGNIPGDTIFGNNTLATGTPAFFIPGGDVSFSAGNFRVNNLHFGPTSLALTNQGITSGNCLQVSGSTLIGGACGTGGAGDVTSVFGRTGAVVGLAGDYSGIYAPLTSPVFAGIPQADTAPVGTNSTQLATTAFVIANRGTTGGLSGSGSPNFIPKFTAASVIGNSLLTDDGTNLSYTGTGGIIAPKFTITQGAYLLESTQAALPALPGANKNGFVSGPDGFYVSNNNSGWFKIQPPGTPGTGGAVDSVFGRIGAVTAAQGDYSFSQISGTLTAGQIGNAAVASFKGRTGAVVPASGDYEVAEVTGAAPLSSPSLTGSPTATTAPLNDSSLRIATTQWVKAQGYGTGGGGGNPQISHSYLNPVCVARNTGSAAITINEPVTEGDTVFVGVSAFGANLTGLGVADGGSSTYTLLQRVTTAANHTTWVFNTTAGGAHAGTTITVTHTGTQKMVACAMAYQNVGAIGTPVASNSTTGVGSVTVSATTTAANSVVFGFIGLGAFVTSSELSGNMLAQNSSTASSAAAAAMCDVVVPTVGTASCGVNLSGNAQHNSLVVALAPVPGGGGTTGTVTSVFGRNGAVVAHNGDYTAAQVGAAPVDSPQFQGVPTAPTPPLTSSSNQVATTAFVAQSIAAAGPGLGGGGGGTPGVITRGSIVCEAKDTTGTSTQTINNLTIHNGDTVIVSFSIPNASSPGATVTDTASNVYTYRTGKSGTSAIRAAIYSTDASQAKAATSVTVNTGYTGRSQVCVATYTGVSGFGSTANPADVIGGTTIAINVHPQDNTGVVYAVAAANQPATFTATGGSLWGQISSPNLGAFSSHAVCDQFSVDSTVAQCSFTSSISSNLIVAGLELRPGAGGGGATGTFPRVVASKMYVVNAGSQPGDILCPAANCPKGIYRLSFTILELLNGSCTGGTTMPNIDYNDERHPPPATRHSGLLTTAFAFTSANSVYGYRVFQNEGTGPVVISQTGAECTAGTGTANGHMYMVLERLE